MQKLIFLIIAVLFSVSGYVGAHANSRQEISDFYLSNLKEDGTSDWEIEGLEATVEGDYINITTMNANYYLDKDTLSVKSNSARLNRRDQSMHLDGNVEMETTQGWNLKTNYLDWQRGNDQIKTTSPVRTEKDWLTLTAKGLYADSQLERADFQEDVQLTFKDKSQKDATTINCDGPLEIEYSTGRAIFRNNVVVDHSQGKLFSDTATLVFDAKEEKIIKIISEGNVKIIRDNNVTFAEKATYLANEERLILEGSPRLIYFPHESEGGSSGFFGVN